MRFVDTSQVRTRFDVGITTRDGVRLSTDLYLPPAPGRYPVLLHRTPYDNNRLPSGRARGDVLRPAPAEQARLLAAHGYVVALQDVRGRGDSEGEFVPFVHEGPDGADTIDSLAGLDEGDGRVATFGSGYAAFAHWAAAVEGPSGLAAMVSAGAMGAPFEGLPTRGGVPRLDWLQWLNLTAGHLLQPADIPVWPAVLASDAPEQMHVVLGRPDLPWPRFVHPDADDPMWTALRDVRARVAAGAVSCPVLHVSGWWDSERRAAFDWWHAATDGRDEHGHRLVIGPWDHEGLGVPTAVLGGFDFGPSARRELPVVLLDWFDATLRGAGPGAADAAADGAEVFVTGRNRWERRSGWSGGSDSTLRLRLSSQGRANTRAGDGRLVEGGHAQEEPPDEALSDPARPVPWQPHAPDFVRGAGPHLDQGFVEVRDEALCYSGDVLDAPLLVVGRPVVELWVSAEASTADWVVLLADALPDGRALHLAHDVVRLPAGDQPPRLTHHRFVLDEIAHEFQPGSRVRLVVTPSPYPLYPRPAAGETTWRRVHHGAGCESAVVLPLARWAD